jgi:hypothetical protein
MDLGEMEGPGLGSSHSGYGHVQVVDFCDSNEPSGSIKCGELGKKLSKQ